MTNRKNTKWDIFKILLLVCAMSFAGFCVVASHQNRILKLDIEGLAEVEALSTGVQRVSKLELENSSDNNLILDLDTSANNILFNEQSYQYFEHNPEILEYAQEISQEWFLFKDAVLQFRANGNRDSLFLASEENYTISNQAIKEITTYINELSSFTTTLEICAMGHVVFMAVLLIKILFDTLSELQKNKELSKDMFIDLSTGLYNRSKCQTVLKNSVTPNNHKERAVVIFDLNDLKKTNDTLGHRAGDQLIATFAEQLKNATKIFPFETFVGRYGGDEFMVYFDSVDEKEVNLYIDEVNFLMKKLNESGTKPFQLSCAAGYSITGADTKALTMRELFDMADGNMYQNKIAMKEKKRQELYEQGIIEPKMEDDRL